VPLGQTRRVRRGVVPLTLTQATFASPSWSPLAVNSPAARTGAAISTDSSGTRVVLFGGVDGSGTNLSDTWTFDGRFWTQQSPATSPPARHDAVLASEGGSNVLLFGGRNSSGLLSDTWRWNGTTWTQLTPSTVPAVREKAAMVYDAAHSKIVLFGGNGAGGFLADTWTWTGSNWTALSPTTSPSARDGAAIAYDSTHTQVTLFGGRDATGLNQDTWTWSGTNWVLASPTNTPPEKRELASMANDPALHGLVLSGGLNTGGGTSSATWLWTGTTWANGAGLYTNALTRSDASMIGMIGPFGSSHGQVLIYGGTNSTGGVRGDSMVLDWPQLGIQGYYSQTSIPLDDHMSLSVNNANGNVTLVNRDMHISGTGLDMEIDRTYNSQDRNSGNVAGNSWNFANNPKFLSQLPDGSIVVYGGGADELYFAYNGSAFTSPPGANANLTLSGGVYSLTYLRSSEVLTFVFGLLASDTDRNGDHLDYTWTGSTSAPVVQTITDTQGRVVTFYYGANNQVDHVTDSTSRSFSFGYTSGDLTSATDTNGATATFAYTGGDLTKITSPSGVNSSVGNITTLAYDVYHRVTSITRVTNTGTLMGPTSTYSYGPPDTGTGFPGDSAGKTSVTDPNSDTTTYQWNHFSQVGYVVDGLGNHRAVTYTANADVQTLLDATAQKTTLGYDPSTNNLTSVALPPTATGKLAAQGTLTYPSSGLTRLPTSATDPQTHCQANKYDTVGNITDTYGGETSGCAGVYTSSNHYSNTYQNSSHTAPCIFGTGVPGELCTTTDTKGTTTYGYDSNGNLIAISPPSPQGGTTITVDSLSRPTSIVDGNGNTLTISYDGLDRVTKRNYNESGDPTCSNPATCVKYNYDDSGNLTSRVDTTGTTHFTYDDLNHLTQKGLPSSTDACSGHSQIIFTYDGVGNLTSFCDAGGTVTYDTYDAANRLTKMTDLNGKVLHFGYNNNDQRTSITFPSATGVIETIGYDGAGNISSVSAVQSGTTTLTSFTYTYAIGTNDTVLRQTVGQPLLGITTTNTYDALNRLQEAKETGATDDRKYTYDGNGNVTSTNINGTVTTVVPNNANELSTVGGVGYSYDADGNETGIPSIGFSLGYNTLGQNTTSVAATGDPTVNMTYADVDQSERTAVGSTTYASTPLGVAAETTGTNSTYYTRDPQGNLITEDVGGNSYYYLDDGLGSTIKLIKGNGTVVNSYRYDPWGNSISKTEAVTNPWQYAGGYLDATGLYKFGQRYYDPATLRWTQQDSVAGTIASPRSLNRYTYAADDPINNRDPGGRSSCGQISFGGFVDCVAYGYSVATSPCGTAIAMLGLGAGLLYIAAGAVTVPVTAAFLVLFSGSALSLLYGVNSYVQGC
jgi:RHS repeat-associated protein